jgi:4-amino-4-deoxy-L-arabinose transferase-like glycosyltransferase
LKYLEKPVVVVLSLLVLSGCLYFSQLGRFALTDPDETFYAQAAKEMAEKGEWLTPQLFGKPQFEKPVLFYIFIEASYKIFGVNEFAARFPSALFGSIGLIAVYLLGRLFFNNRTGIFSALILATNIEYVMLSVGCVTDMMLSAFLLSGVLFFFYGMKGDRGVFFALSAASFALATLTKGPLFILLPAFIIALYLVCIKDFSVFKRPGIVMLSAAVFAAIALPWYLAMYKMHGALFTDEFFGFQNVTRFLMPEHKIGSELWYNVPIVFGGFFPWSAFLPVGLWRMVSSIGAARPAEKKAPVFILLWFAVIFVFFSVSSTKLPTYIFPCFVSLALIVGRLWDEFLDAAAAGENIPGMKASQYLLMAAVACAMIGGYVFIMLDSPQILTGAAVCALFLALGMGLSLAAFIAKKFLATFLFIVYSVGIITLPITSLVMPGIDGYESSRPISKIIMERYRKGDVIGSERDYRPGVAFYTGVMPVFLSNSVNLNEYVRAGKTVWGVLKRRNIVDGDKRVIYSYGKKCLVTNMKASR